VIAGATRLVGLIGQPVSDSLSPRMQNAAFAARGLDWAYVPLPVEDRRFEAAVAGLVALGFAGANVTAPYKTRVLAFCDQLDEVATRAGSVNTLVVRDGLVVGSSTDGEVVRALEPRGKRALVLGAGGAAQALATALLDAGVAEISFAARRPDTAVALASRMRSVAPEAAVSVVETWPPAATDADLVVNCTPIRDGRPLDPTARQGLVDLAYRADGRPTALAAAAEEAGCDPVIDGLEVLALQGAASFERWTGVSAPLDVMRAAVRFPG
jgi:shikimate dehydrogenase